MQFSPTTCSRFIDLEIKCMHCNGRCVKNGHVNTKQRFLYKECKRTFFNDYSYNACLKKVNDRIILYTKSCCAIRSISKILLISPTTLIKRILEINNAVKMPKVKPNEVYEMDELCTYVGSKNKQVWVTYAINRITKEVVDFRVGSLSYEMLGGVIQTLIAASALKVYTDKLPAYRVLLPKSIHSTKFRGTNHIERMNLNLRTHLKRLNRRTICFSKSIVMLSACLKIYFCG